MDLLPVGLLAASVAGADGVPARWPAHIQRVLDTVPPLKYRRGRRLPLYLWPAMDPGRLSQTDADWLVRELDRRGVGLVCRWDWSQKEQSLADALVVARAQHRRRLLVNIDATSCLYAFFDGDPRTAHVDAEGQPFWDTSFGPPHIGCPFAIDYRRPAIRERIEWFADAYLREGLKPGFVFADWEVDGPMEWNGAWEASKRCRRCRERMPEIDNFLAFQKTLRDLRADLQHDVYAEPLRRRFPDVLVGNYAVYPNDGFRYWYDYFETEDPTAPGLSDQRARYRHWASEFEASGYTFAMPVVYTWERIWNWFDYEPGDYRWFSNMLRVASNAGRHTPAGVPVISFVHWHTTAPSDPPNPSVQQMSESAYQELLWHMLLRGIDGFFLWCMPDEQVKEMSLLHPVWAAAQEYGDFLDHGVPVCFDVPMRPAPVVSALLWGDRLLARRTDYGTAGDPVELMVYGRPIRIPASPGRCQLLSVSRGR